VRFTLNAPGAEEVRLVRAGAVLASVGGAQGDVSLFGVNLGEGPSTVWAEASYPDGTTARSERRTIAIDGSAFADQTVPVAFEYTRTVAPGQTVLVSLPAQVAGDPAGVAYEITGGFSGDAELLWH